MLILHYHQLYLNLRLGDFFELKYRCGIFQVAKENLNYQVYASSWMPVYKAIIGVGCHVYESVQGTSKHNLQLFQNILSSSDFLFSSELNMCLLLSKCCHLSVPSLLLRDYPFGFLKQNPGTAESTISLCLK